jgi:hypothetical protein
MEDIVAYSHASAKGTFWLRQRNSRWHAYFEDEDLGSYHSALSACADLVGGHTYWPSCGDPSVLGLSDELSEWQAHRGGRR